MGSLTEGPGEKGTRVIKKNSQVETRLCSRSLSKNIMILLIAKGIMMLWNEELGNLDLFMYLQHHYIDKKV